MDSNFFLAIAIVGVLAFTSGYLIWFLYRYMKNSNPTAGKIQSDLVKMREKIKPYLGSLIPWSAEEWSLLSSNMGEHHQQKGLVKEAHGVVHTIYHEPIYAYAYRKYAAGKHSLLLIRTKRNEYVFWKKNKITEVFKNSEAYGIINEEGVLLAKNGKDKVGLLSKGVKESAFPVVIHGKEVATLATQPETVQPRAFDFVMELVDEDQEKLLVLTLPKLLEKQIAFK